MAESPAEKAPELRAAISCLLLKIVICSPNKSLAFATLI